MTLEQKLYDIFEKKLHRLESGTFAVTEYSRLILLNDRWNDCLDSVGVERIGLLMSMITQKSPDHVHINDPLVFGGNQGIISMKTETAMKIVALGGLP